MSRRKSMASCPSEYFFRNRKSPDGFNTPCKRCQREGGKPLIEDIPDGFKRCIKCKDVKRLEDFPPLSSDLISRLPPDSKQQGRKARCKDCKAEKSREYYNLHP